MPNLNARLNAAAQPTIAVREYTNELSSQTAALRESREKLSAEIGNIKKSRDEIQEEYQSAVKEFVKAQLTELTGPKFDAMAELALSIPTLTGQGLAFFRQKQTEARDRALQSINDYLARTATQKQTVDAESFQSLLAVAKEHHDSLTEKDTAAVAAISKAEQDLTAWQKTPQYNLVALDIRAGKEGAPRLTPDNKAYYTPKHVWNLLGKSALYKEIYDALDAAGEGEKGTDHFAEMKNYIDRTAALTKAVEDAKADSASIIKQYRETGDIVATLASAATGIKTDAQILDAVQDKAVTYFATPEFLAAATAKYAEEFKHVIPLMSAKISALDKLEDGVNEKMKSLDGNIAAVRKEYQRYSQYDQNQRMKKDIKALREQNAALRTGYDNFTVAANQTVYRTQNYAPASTTVYVNQGPDFFDILLMNELLNAENRDYEIARMQANNSFVAPSAPLTPYTADLFNVNRESAAQYNLPASTFDVLPQENAPALLPDTGLTNSFDVVHDEEPAPREQRQSDDFDVTPRGNSSDGNDDRNADQSGQNQQTSDDFNVVATPDQDNGDQQQSQNNDNFTVEQPAEQQTYEQPAETPSYEAPSDPDPSPSSDSFDMS